MRVQIAEGNFSGLVGNAEMSRSWETIVWLDILPDYPMRFAERELIRIASGDDCEHSSDKTA